MIQTCNTEKIFKTNYARVAPFLTSYARLKFARICMPFIDDIVRINTDSFLCKHKCDVPMSSFLGDFKLEHDGKCKVKNSNCVQWY